MTIGANTFGSNYDTVVSVYTGVRGALTLVPNACNDDFSGLQSRVQFDATGGTTYYFLIGFCCGVGGSGGGNLVFSVEESLPANFTVDSTADAVDANPGDGVCASGPGECTLRAAIMETNALPAADIITLPAGTYLLTLAGAGEDAAFTGDLDITGNLTINGAGANTTIIDADGIDRVLHVSESINVNLSDVTIKNGMIVNDLGGGIYNNYGTLTLTNSTVSNNTSPWSGGGIYNNYGTLTLTNSTVSNNMSSASVGGGGIYSHYGALTLTNSTVSDNMSSEFGGGIYSQYGTLTLDNSMVSGNIGESGGGIFNEDGAVILNNSTVSGNTGGGIVNYGNDSTLTLNKSTIRANTAAEGGGISNSGTVTLTDSIVGDNSAYHWGGGIFNGGGGTMTLNSSTVNNNTACCYQGYQEGAGGGIFNDGNLILNNSTISGNSALALLGTPNGGGGGIYSRGTLALNSNTVSSNSATVGGGGLRVDVVLRL
jgi:CSLREA domain-containing protein